MRIPSEPGEFSHFNGLPRILYDQALLAEGGTLEEPVGFIRRMNQLLLEIAAK